MSISYIPLQTKLQLWAQSAGRCQYENCGKSLYLESLTKVEFNTSYIAHIVADQPDGPRGHPTLSEKLKSDISNLMLLCDEHHRLIDKVRVTEHHIERLTEMKRLHEERISSVTEITPDRRSHIVLFGANIGQHDSPLSYRDASMTILGNKRYPAYPRSIDLGLKNSIQTDDATAYWQHHLEQLEIAFAREIGRLKGNHEVQHFSVFGLAPMPLLIRLGTLFSDIYEADIYQRHREPSSWQWQSDMTVPDGYFILHPPASFAGPPVLNISLSATISNDRISAALDPTASIWTLTHENPHNDFLKTKSFLEAFRKAVRLSLDKIKLHHGQDTPLNIFPAMPVSASIEFGRVWMPKADLSLVVFDQNNKIGSFIKTITIKN